MISVPKYHSGVLRVEDDACGVAILVVHDFMHVKQ